MLFELDASFGQGASQVVDVNCFPLVEAENVVQEYLLGSTDACQNVGTDQSSDFQGQVSVFLTFGLS
jgi:hypothetical protein